MRAAIPIFGTLEASESTAFLMCPILRGKMGLKYAPALAGAASEMGGAAEARPRGVVACLYASPTVGEVAALVVRPEGCGSLRFLSKMRKPSTPPPSPAAQAPTLPCTAGEAF